MNRITYVAHFVYWLCVQRSWARAVWVMDYQGKTWK